jgi:hypothetical protein
MRSGFGVSGGGSRAQLDTLSTGLNLRSDNGLCNPIVALQSSVYVSADSKVLTHGQACELETSTHRSFHHSS